MTTTPAGRAVFGMFGIFAKYERAMIQERIIAGKPIERPVRGGPGRAGELELPTRSTRSSTDTADDRVRLPEAV